MISLEEAIRREKQAYEYLKKTRGHVQAEEHKAYMNWFEELMSYKEREAFCKDCPKNKIVVTEDNDENAGREDT